MKPIHFKTALTACVALAPFVLAQGAQAEGFVYVNDHADIGPLCGDEPLRVALVDGYGGNSWRKTAFAEIEDEASKCDNIVEVTYAEAGGDLQAYNAAIEAARASSASSDIGMYSPRRHSVPRSS